MSKISGVWAREILDSRGSPTVEVEVVLDDGSAGRASVPSGASTGAHEAIELRDGDSERYFGKGVQRAVASVKVDIAKEIVGLDASCQDEVDYAMIRLDGTPNKRKLGANAVLGVSLAIAKAAANHFGLPLYRYLGGASAKLLPVPLLNIINGGKHADNPIDIQEFMVVPLSANSFRDALRMGAEIFNSLKSGLSKAGLSTAVGDEGGFAPEIESTRVALDFVMKSIEETGYCAGTDAFLALDCASSEYFKNGLYCLDGEDKKLSTDENVDYLASLVRDYPIFSIEDGCAEDDWGRMGVADEGTRRKMPFDRRRFIRDQSKEIRRRNSRRQRECHSCQAEPDRHGIGNAHDIRDGAKIEFCRRHVASIGRNRRHNDRGYGGRVKLRIDQGRLAISFRPHGEVQSPPAHRRRTWRCRRLSRRQFDFRKSEELRSRKFG